MANTLNAASQGTRSYLALISFIAALGGFLFGFDTAVVSGTLEYLRTQYRARRRSWKVWWWPPPWWAAWWELWSPAR